MKSSLRGWTCIIQEEKNSIERQGAAHRVYVQGVSGGMSIMSEEALAAAAAVLQTHTWSTNTAALRRSVPNSST